MFSSVKSIIMNNPLKFYALGAVVIYPVAVAHQAKTRYNGIKADKFFKDKTEEEIIKLTKESMEYSGYGEALFYSVGWGIIVPLYGAGCVLEGAGYGLESIIGKPITDYVLKKD